MAFVTADRVLDSSTSTGTGAFVVSGTPAAGYRTFSAVMSVGKANGVPVMDPADAFAGCGTTEPMLSYDALHMTAAGHACLGEWLASQLCPSPD